MIKKCPDCRHVYKLPDKYKKIQRRDRLPKNLHRCGWAECSNCEKEVDMTERKCFIQRLPKRHDAPRFNKVPLDKVNGRPFYLTKDPTKVQVPKDPPLQVYADFEAVTDEEGKQTPILVCFETDESDETVVCEGPNCTGL